MGNFLRGTVGEGNLLASLRIMLFVVLLLILMFGNVVYQVSRWGFVDRLIEHRARGSSIFPSPDFETPSVTILIPSYKEDLRTIRQTVVSAALQAYPDVRVVLLIDDPPNPSADADRALLDTARSIPGEVERLFEEPLRLVRESRARFQLRAIQAKTNLDLETSAFRQLTCEIADWLALEKEHQPQHDNVDRFFCELTFAERARLFSLDSEAFIQASVRQGKRAVLDGYDYFERMLSPTIQSFERKR